MLVKELVLDDVTELKERNTGQILATIKIASIVQYPSHTAVRLGFEAPQSTKITFLDTDKKDLLKNGYPQKQHS